MSGRHRGKRFRAAYEKVDRDHHYPPAEAVALVKQTASTKFDETVEVHLRLGVNVRHAEEQLRGTLALPHGLGKEVTVAVFAEGDAAKAATEAGADHVGGAGPRRPRQRGLDRLRRRDRHPRPDGPGGLEAGPHPGPAGQDAEPEGRHGDQRHRQGRERGEGRQGRVPHRPSGRRSPDDRQGQLRGAGPARELRRRDRGDRSRQAGRGQGPLPALDHPGDDHGPGDPGGRLPHPRGRDHGRGRERLGVAGEAEPAPAEAPA